MAKSLFSCLLGSLAAGLAVAAPTIEARAPAVALAENTLALARVERQGGRPRPFYQNHRVAAINVEQADAEPVAVGWSPAVAWQHEIEYLTAVKASGNNVSLIVDTGSSDTWFVRENFQCMDRYRRKAAANSCHFGSPFKGDFSGGAITNQHFNITYGFQGGPFMNGPMGYSDLTVANVTIPKQQIGLATVGYWPNGDGTSSGILGLGLPGLTDAFSGTDASRDTLTTMVQYNPLVTTMSGQVTPIFSLALSRDSSQSFLAFGGVPANTKTTGEWATSPITKVALRSGGEQYLYYQIAPQKFVWNSSTLNGNITNPPEMIVDSGTTLNLFPYEMARSINSMFTPKAVLDSDEGSWYVDCKATAPTLAVQLGGKMVYTDPKSMILPNIRNAQGQCATGVGATNGWPYILGDTFMQGLVSVFDIGPKMELRFAHRA